MASKTFTYRGWVQSIRVSKTRTFMDIRCIDVDPSEQTLQFIVDTRSVCVPHCVTKEAFVEVTGRNVTSERSKLGFEIHVDHITVIGSSEHDIDSKLRHQASVAHRFDQRHLMLRTTDVQKIIRVRAEVMRAFREYYHNRLVMEVDPPTLVETLCEGGSDLFATDYFGKPAYLTQSSQMYLEPLLASHGPVYCMQSSYRAEESTGPRHLTEFKHVEAEHPFETFKHLLSEIEHLVIDVRDAVAKRFDVAVPEFKKKFKRMTYADAVKYCRDHDIYKDDETKENFVYGDDIPSGPERKMIDMIGEPVLLIRFPAQMKSFYMSRCTDGPKDSDGKFMETESVDLLMPGVGEIVGGSMRVTDHDELYRLMKDKKMDTDKYQWYLDVRKYGSCPHGGYGLGLDRFVMWILGLDHIRDGCLFPRYMGRIYP